MEIRPITADETEPFLHATEAAFHEDVHEEDLELFRELIEPERTLAGFDGDKMVATAGIFTRELTIPGAVISMPGVTLVGVQPTHRRRGVLTQLMRRQIDDIHAAGEPVAGLWASESAIYGRFGYGVASQLLRIEVDRVDASLRRDIPDDRDLRLRVVAADDARPDIERVEQLLLDTRPGQFSRDKRWIEQLVHDPESRRGGMSKLECLTVRNGDDVVGYALYRMKPESVRPHMLPDGDLFVFAQGALTPEADAALTRTLLATDLMRRVRWWNRAVDTPIPHLLQDARHARTTVLDGLHLRVVDVPAALSARSYAAPVDVVLEVRDALCPWNDGRWQVRGDRSGATCTATDADAQLRLDVEALGAAYLGGTTLATLAAAGRVDAGDAEALARASTGFGWDVAPWCPVVF